MDEQVRVAVLGILPELHKLGVTSLSVFGSASRSALTPESDVDFLVRFELPTRDAYFQTLFLLEDTLNRKIDLVMEGKLHPLIEKKVLSEAIRVA